MPAADSNKSTAILLRGIGGHYLLHSHQDNFQGLAMLRGILRLENVRPLPGDKAVYGPSDDPDIPYVIEEILPRKSFLARPGIANLDLVLITISASRPRPDLKMVDRLIVMSHTHDIDVILLINKIDELDDPTSINNIKYEYAKAGIMIFETGFTSSEADIQQLKDMIKEKTVSFAGQSGTGKSTLLNRLFDMELMETGGLSGKIGRGRHTTRYTELFPAETGGYLADTPGFSQVNLAEADITLEDLANGYDEIRKVKNMCRFASCRHAGDLGCAVTEETMPAGRYERYLELRTEILAAQEY
ncbi:MAG TPA: ribosome small subunit-dependent GTPase A [Bacillota bacterium]|nr:ribosome small subunit-dependent GTPase A [Bacillota bacterium]